MIPMRIALLTHSTNPRGGVAHALSLGEALCDLGHHVTVFAPDPSGGGFPRSVRCRTVSVPAEASDGSLLDLVHRRVAEYVHHFDKSADNFDIYHAQDGISGNALATLAAQRRINCFVRTVHHLDDFDDYRLSSLQDRSVATARQVICVSRTWAERLRQRYGNSPAVIFNGVDAQRFSTEPDNYDDVLRQQYGFGSGPLFLSVGGIEPRKNSIRLLEAFARFRHGCRSAQLVIAGGASLLNHDAYRAAFDTAMKRVDEPTRRAVVIMGVVPDPIMPALMRSASALLFPSVKEGFGLVVLEAMACGTPVIASRIEPFTEYLGEADCAWCDPMRIPSIEAAMHQVVAGRASFRERGLAVASRFPWTLAADQHANLYRSILQAMGHAADAVSGALAG
jgi:glycosyltransferase-like protein